MHLLLVRVAALELQQLHLSLPFLRKPAFLISGRDLRDALQQLYVLLFDLSNVLLSMANFTVN